MGLSNQIKLQADFAFFIFTEDVFYMFEGLLKGYNREKPKEFKQQLQFNQADVGQVTRHHIHSTIVIYNSRAYFLKLFFFVMYSQTAQNEFIFPIYVEITSKIWPYLQV